MNKKNYIVLVLSFLLAVSCSSRRKTADGDKIKSMSTDRIVDSLVFNEFSTDWYRAKAEAELNFAGEKNKVKVNLRVRKDSAIWCNLSKAGIQIVTTLFSEDSVKFLKKINGKEYFLGTWTELNLLLGIDLNYHLLQDFIFGNAIAFDADGKYKHKIQDESYLLSSTKSKKINKIIEKGKNTKYHLLYRCWVNPQNFRCNKVQLNLIDDSLSIYTNYLNWKPYSGQLYPLSSSIYVETPTDTIQIELNYNSKLKLGVKQKFPFKITESYTPFEINE